MSLEDIDANRIEEIKQRNATAGIVDIAYLLRCVETLANELIVHEIRVLAQSQHEHGRRRRHV